MIPVGDVDFLLFLRAVQGVVALEKGNDENMLELRDIAIADHLRQLHICSKYQQLCY